MFIWLAFKRLDELRVCLFDGAQLQFVYNHQHALASGRNRKRSAKKRDESDEQQAKHILQIILQIYFQKYLQIHP